jgi:RNA polymerase sigma factor (sigma-70 family)
MDHPSTVPELVHAARTGDADAWNELVDRFLPMVAGVIGRLRLSPADAADVNQTVWLRLVEHLDDLRDPRALPGWLATTAHREGLRTIDARRRTVSVDPQAGALDEIPHEAEIDTLVLAEERAQALRDGLAELPAPRRELLELLVADPPVSYEEISKRLGIPIGSIGPTRARALAQLRSTRALRAWTDAAPAVEGGGRNVSFR